VRTEPFQQTNHRHRSWLQKHPFEALLPVVLVLVGVVVSRGF
jgi:hypothetical protein